MSTQPGSFSAVYIDDLDRCSPARVVEVLAAIHLMLALPLFVVIVAVDPRWLLEALRHHYRELIAWEPAATAPGDRPSTPLDYLDKIFQIPFTVRSLTPENAAGYLASLLGQETQLQQTQGPDRTAPDEPDASSTDAGRPDSGQDVGHSTGHGTGGREAGRAPLAEPPSFGPSPSAADRPSPAGPANGPLPGFRPGGLVLLTQESEFMSHLGPLPVLTKPGWNTEPRTMASRHAEPPPVRWKDTPRRWAQASRCECDGSR